MKELEVGDQFNYMGTWLTVLRVGSGMMQGLVWCIYKDNLGQIHTIELGLHGIEKLLGKGVFLA